MSRTEFVLGVLALAKDKEFSPVQVQKLFFLIGESSDNVEVKGFDFVPYHYGPYDKNLYRELDALCEMGFVKAEIKEGRSYKTFSITKEGVKVAESIPEEEKIISIADFVTKHSFRELVKFVYDKFPEMKTNSVFVD
jgi:uncharacterized protein YwgA